MCLSLLLLHICCIAGFRFIHQHTKKVGLLFLVVSGAQQGNSDAVVDAVGQFANSAVSKKTCCCHRCSLVAFHNPHLHPSIHL